MDRTVPPPEAPRPRTTLRLSVTDRCNLRCAYCMPAGGRPVDPGDRLPALEVLADAVEWLAGHFPLAKVRLTGGEPTVRRGLPDLVRCLAASCAVPEVTLTTNGTRLAELAAPLAEAGLARVNISLDTLDPRRYAELTRGGQVERALAGLHAALAAGLAPVKVNAVLRRSSWREDVPALLDLAVETGVEIRFLELMRTGTEAAWAARELVPASRVREWLGAGPLADSSGEPARTGAVRWRGRVLRVGWITPVSDPFCDGCTRLRLDARGRLRRCLMDPETLDLFELMASAAAHQRLVLFLAGKRAPAFMRHRLPMVGLGG